MANAALVDFFLKIDGIEGESGDSKHKSEIDLLSWSWGTTNGGSMHHQGGGGSGKAAVQDLHFTMRMSKASTKLMEACVTGKHIPKAILICRKAGGNQEEYFKATFSDLLVSSFQTGGHHHEAAVLTEQVSLNFAKFEFEYKEQKADGSLGGAIKAGWDIKANKKV